MANPSELKGQRILNNRPVCRRLGDLVYFTWAVPLVLFGSAVKNLKNPHWTKVLGIAHQPSEQESSSQIAGPNNGISRHRGIATAVRRAARYLPGKHNCLTQALAGQIMLSQLGTPGTVIIGLKPTRGNSAWDTHAWLVSSEGIILGGEVAGDFVPVTSYRKTPGNRG